MQKMFLPDMLEVMFFVSGSLFCTLFNCKYLRYILFKETIENMFFMHQLCDLIILFITSII